MKFLRLPDYLLSTLFEDDDIIAIDKPYGLNAHTNDSKIEHSDAIEDGLIEIYEKQRGSKLHIIHRLDQTTTGVMIFGKSAESAKKYAEYFFNRQVKKTYLFITQYKSEKKSAHINQPIIHKAKELQAETSFEFVKESKKHQLWQAFPHTGRNHQIRIHSQALGLSILGDVKYEGHPYPFLCLHNKRIEFPNGVVLLSKPPAYFEDLTLLEDPSLAKLFFETDRRQRLFAQTGHDQSFRLAYQESVFSLDQFGDKLLLTWSKHGREEMNKNVFSNFATRYGKPLLEQKLAEDQSMWTTCEGNIKIEIESDFPGLALNQRLHRNWVFNHSQNKSVLNLFASTCTYAAAAVLGGAAKVTCVEMSKKALNRARRNFELNELKTENTQFLCRDSLTFLKQSLQKKLTYDLILCEVPSFFRREKGVFRIENDLEDLLQNCIQSLNAEGMFLISIHFDGLFIDDIRKIVLNIQKKLNLKQLEMNCILPSLDFELPGEKTHLKSFLIRI